VDGIWCEVPLTSWKRNILVLGARRRFWCLAWSYTVILLVEHKIVGKRLLMQNPMSKVPELPSEHWKLFSTSLSDGNGSFWQEYSSCTISRTLNPGSPRGWEVHGRASEIDSYPQKAENQDPYLGIFSWSACACFFFRRSPALLRLGFFCMCSQCIPKAAIQAASLIGHLCCLLSRLSWCFVEPSYILRISLQDLASYIAA